MLLDESADGMRLDSFLHSKFPQFSRSRWSQVLARGVLQLNHKAAESSTRLKNGQTLTFNASEDIHILDSTQIAFESAENLKNLKYKGEVPSILFEDDDLCVIDKPAGLAVHPGSGLQLDETLVGWAYAEKKYDAELVDELLKAGPLDLEVRRPGIVHRLDKGTSGVMVIAKSRRAHQPLSEQFSRREASRLYFAVIPAGISKILEKRSSQLDAWLQKQPCPLAIQVNSSKLFSFVSFLERDPVSRIKFRVSPLLMGKKAITHFIEVSKSDTHSLVELKLETGRTHQIRVHLAFLGFPILGDHVYGGKEDSRIRLHAHSLTLTHPISKERMQFSAPWDEKSLCELSAMGLVPESRILEAIKGGASISNNDSVEEFHE